MACASSTQLSGTSCRKAEPFEVKLDGSDRVHKSRIRRNGQTCTDLEQYKTDLQPETALQLHVSDSAPRAGFVGGHAANLLLGA